jgi:hypothetical protein
MSDDCIFKADLAPHVKYVPLCNIHGKQRYPTTTMSIVALQKLLHILSNKLTAQFYMSVRSEQDGCRSYVPSICSYQNTDHAQIGIAIPDVELSSFDRFIFCFLIFKDPGNLRKGLDKKDKSSQDLYESFSTIYRLG